MMPKMKEVTVFLDTGVLVRMPETMDSDGPEARSMYRKKFQEMFSSDSATDEYAPEFVIEHEEEVEGEEDESISAV